jgi:peptide-methionine (S)-S-oxide reductase
MAEATFAAGCFWGVEDAFRKEPGVTDVKVGYTGGGVDTPTYEHVCSGTTGHAEAVLVTYDDAQVSYEELLSLFFKVHDPRQINRQGPDVGTQYRSAIFFHDAAQESSAKAVVEGINSALGGGPGVATEIVPAVKFWLAEEYHQQYFEKQRGRPEGWFSKLTGN